MTAEGVRGRREEYTEATRQALLQAATHRFATDGYTSVSLDAISRDARLTKGAVYHHFANKQALFQAVLEQLDNEAVELISARASTKASTWDAAIAGLDAFLDHCLDRTYQRICFQEGPTALGFTQWWAHGEQHVAGLIKILLTTLRDEQLIQTTHIDALASILYGALTASALDIARAKHPRAVRDKARITIIQLIEGLRPRTTIRSPASRRGGGARSSPRRH